MKTLRLWNGKHGLSITVKEDSICYCERNMSENKEFNILFRHFKTIPAKNKELTITV